MLTATCHCGAIRIDLPAKPETVTDCNCSICRRYGTLWAYYKESEVQVHAAPGATKGYAWGRKVLRFVGCVTCGCITHWERIVPVAGSKMGVNARNFEPGDLAGIPVRLLDAASS